MADRVGKEQRDEWYRRDFTGMLHTFEALADKDPTDGGAFNMIGYSHGHLNAFPKALEAIKKYITLQPDVDNSYDSAWELSMWAGQYDEAVGFANEAMSINPAWKSFDELAGRALIHKGMGEAARQKFHRSLELFIRIALLYSFITFLVLSTSGAKGG